MSPSLAAERPSSRVPEPWHSAITMALQPIVGLDGAVLGREALLRTNPELQPEELFQLAAAEGWVTELDAHAAGLAVHAASEWAGDGELLFVNAAPMPPTDFPVWLSRLGRAAVRADFPLERIVVELNENQTGGTRPVLPRLLNAARSVGLRFALDDIDAGPMSVRMLTSLSAEFVKVDGSVVAALHEPDVAERVQRLVQSAQDRGTVVIAEKVEHEAQVDQLLELGVQHYQGWLMGAPAATAPAAGEGWRRVS